MRGILLTTLKLSWVFISTVDFLENNYIEYKKLQQYTSLKCYILVLFNLRKVLRYIKLVKTDKFKKDFVYVHKVYELEVSEKLMSLSFIDSYSFLKSLLNSISVKTLGENKTIKSKIYTYLYFWCKFF